mmetsp:Transcript_44335/g.135081  ORF Transcript_44335/g.135081 Transcript_44335/m.135081 type:complete len:217 (-) Transcript_44335:85-735(-)
MRGGECRVCPLVGGRGASEQQRSSPRRGSKGGRPHDQAGNGRACPRGGQYARTGRARRGGRSGELTWPRRNVPHSHYRSPRPWRLRRPRPHRLRHGANLPSTPAGERAPRSRARQCVVAPEGLVCPRAAAPRGRGCGVARRGRRGRIGRTSGAFSRGARGAPRGAPRLHALRWTQRSSRLMIMLSVAPALQMLAGQRLISSPPHHSEANRVPTGKS